MGLDKTPPSNDQIEVSVFGPGYGECILVHLCENIWLVIDSCLHPESSRPYPLFYLEELGLNPTDCIKYIVATHWHNDHIQGLAEIVGCCHNSNFVCSSAIKSEEFTTLLSAYSNRAMVQETGIEEFKQILDIMIQREPNCEIKLAFQDRPLFRDNLHSIPGSQFEIHSLSPSDYAVIMAIQDIGKLIPHVKTTKGVVPSVRPNHTSVVISITIGNVCLLFGADLENTGDARTGWAKIIGSTTCPPNKAHFFKIAHHGSENGDNPNIWTNLLNLSYQTALTPFALGNVYLPRKKDLERIKSSSGSNPAYITSLPKWKRSSFKDKMVQKTIRESGIKLNTYNKTHGHIRFRTKINVMPLNWSVELDGEATLIDKLI